jgi:hypothetical protein
MLVLLGFRSRPARAAIRVGPLVIVAPTGAGAPNAIGPLRRRGDAHGSHGRSRIDVVTSGQGGSYDRVSRA